MATTDNLVKLGQLQTALTRVKSELDNLDGKSFSSVDVSGGKINFYATNDHTGTALESIDLPEEIFLDQTQTTFVQSFAFNSATYPGATNPNLEGKPVLVLAVKGDKSTNPTLTYSFINLETLVDTYTAANAGISIAGYSIGVKLSTPATNILSIANDGLLAELKLGTATQDHFAVFGAGGYIADGGFSLADVDARGKVDKVTNATQGNIVTFGASGAVVDSGVTFASDTDINNILTNIFGASSTGTGSGEGNSGT